METRLYRLYDEIEGVENSIEEVKNRLLNIQQQKISEENVYQFPSYFEMLLLASGRVIAEAPTSVLTVEMPMKVSDLVNTVDMMLSQIERRLKKEKKKPKTRSWKEQNYISNAKFLLMERNHLSEEDAYRYIQKCSMDSGTNMVETAQMVLMLLYDEV